MSLSGFFPEELYEKHFSKLSRRFESLIFHYSPKIYSVFTIGPQWTVHLIVETIIIYYTEKK